MECNSIGQMRANAWRMDVSNKIQRKVAAPASDSVNFTGQLQNAGAADDTTGIENYKKYLEKRYGNVTIQSIGKDRESLERALEAKENESETTSDIVVKPDGSRVLVVTMNIGGMETTMSLEISKPTTLPNDCETEIEEDEINSDWQETSNR